MRERFTEGITMKVYIDRGIRIIALTAPVSAIHYQNISSTIVIQLSQVSPLSTFFIITKKQEIAF